MRKEREKKREMKKGKKGRAKGLQGLGLETSLRNSEENTMTKVYGNRAQRSGAMVWGPGAPALIDLDREHRR